MAGEIKHEWNGTVLSITSDAGTSTADLQGPRGPQGVRGPQGPSGVIYDEDGYVYIDLSPYYLKEEVDGMIDEIEQDYASKVYVTSEIAKAKIEAADIDTSGFVTKDDLKNYATQEDIDNYQTRIDNYTIKRHETGEIFTAIGGGIVENYHAVIYPNCPLTGHLSDCELVLREIDNNLINFDTVIGVEVKFADGTIDTFLGVCPKLTPDATFGYHSLVPSVKNNTYVNNIVYTTSRNSYTGKRVQIFELEILDNAHRAIVIERIAMSINELPKDKIYEPIDARFIPIDENTLAIVDGKLTVIGGGSGLESSEEVYY